MAEHHPSDELVLTSSARNARKLFGLGAGVILIEAVTLVVARSVLTGMLESLVLIVLVAAIAGTGVVSIFSIFRLVSSKPALLIDAVGIRDCYSWINPGTIYWREVADARGTLVGTQPFLSIDVKNPEAVISRQRSALKRWLLRFSVRRGWGIISISADSFDAPSEDIISYVRQRLDASHQEKRNPDRND